MNPYVELEKLNEDHAIKIRELNHNLLKMWLCIHSVEIVTGIDYSKIVSRSRKRPIVEARHYLVFTLKQKTYLNINEIGRLAGGLDHSTVLSALKNVDNLCQSDKAYNQRLQDILKKV